MLKFYQTYLHIIYDLLEETSETAVGSFFNAYIHDDLLPKRQRISEVSFEYFPQK